MDNTDGVVEMCCADDGECDGDGACSGGCFCDAGLGMCLPRRTRGRPCHGGRQCIEPLACVAGRCAESPQRATARDPFAWQRPAADGGAPAPMLAGTAAAAAHEVWAAARPGVVMCVLVSLFFWGVSRYFGAGRRLSEPPSRAGASLPRSVRSSRTSSGEWSASSRDAKA